MRIIVFGHNDWWVWQRQGFCTRNAALVRELAARDEVTGLVVVDSPWWGPRTHRPASARREAVSVVGPKTLAVRYAYALPLPSTWRTGRRVNERLASPRLVRSLEAASHSGAAPRGRADGRLGRRSTARGGGSARAARPVRLRRDRRLARHAWAGEATVSHGYRLAARHADVVFAVHPRLLELLQPAGHGEVLFNAVDARPWADAAAAEALAGAPRTAGGLRGTDPASADAPDSWQVSRGCCPRARFMLSGASRRRTGASSATRARTRGLRASGRTRAPRPGSPRVTSASSLHVRDELTATMDPLKLYEYAAAGKPVVSTVSSPNSALAGQVAVAPEAESFAAAVAAEARDDERRAVRFVGGPSRTRRGRAGSTAYCRCSGRRSTAGGSRSDRLAVIAHYGDAAATTPPSRRCGPVGAPLPLRSWSSTTAAGCRSSPAWR